MSLTPTPMVYVRLRSRIRIQRGRSVKLGDVAHLLTSPEEQERRLLELELLHPGPEDGNLILIDILQIIPQIRRVLPDVTVELIGSGHTLVEVVAGSGKPSKSLFILVWLLLFFGSALTIMNFHADVNMQEVQIRIVEMITGRRDEHPYLFQVAYSIGIGFGMAVFFNHLFKKKWNEEPTPLEVEMFLYQQNVDKYVVIEETERMHEEERREMNADERS
ncbi:MULTISPECIES: stage V sporulation protein AA [Paenibacillus]|uniref:stage V sporulation protein AA n=1 Tax=Paenibacillus TaxID=44249 RepID=UPI0004014F04|nr:MULTISPECIES: stage V sporulation protein AA [Paenibacillus]KGP81578.1 stage V sporulation protein AA [Paenibacillus sp. MAEPY1]KGP81611.1 stage V sporulation protein AA [Paenibacillus sp. MAEPY2]OZQ72442.1 stage V sporulation protein AA [Paenibacillus taichungensis]HBU85789.1 stage V sporulation protein AA [Paenibacillus sp.]